MKNIVAIVQARLGSSRLPAKSLLTLRGFPLIDWVGIRLARSKFLSGVVFALPDSDLDDPLADHLAKQGRMVYRGSQDDVLSRFLGAAKMVNADYIVRVCADNPLIWWEAVDRLIQFYFSANADYTYNHIPRNNLWPDGLGAEMVSAGLLRELDSCATTLPQREHCLNYIWDNSQKFRIATFNPDEEWLRRPDLKLDIDTLQDFQKMSSFVIDPAIDGQQMINACVRKAANG